MSDYLDPNNEELLKDFFTETTVMVQNLEENILVLENDPSNRDAIDEIFRAAHTLKGGASTVQMEEIAHFTHLVEDVLDKIRNGELSIDGALIDCLLNSIDIIKAMLEERAAGSVYQEDISQTKTKLQTFLGNNPEEPAEKEAPVSPKESAKTAGSSTKKSILSSEKSGLSEYEILEMKEAAGKDIPIYLLDISFNEDNPMNTVGGIQVFAALKNSGEILKTDPDFDSLYEDNFFPHVKYFIASQADPEDLLQKAKIRDVTLDAEIMEIKAPVSDKKKNAAPKNQESPKEKPETKEKSQKEEQVSKIENNQDIEQELKENTEQNPKIPDKKKREVSSILRVDSKRIDNLLNLVSETVINKATFSQISNEFQDLLQDFGIAVADLQERSGEITHLLSEGSLGQNAQQRAQLIEEKLGPVLSKFNSYETIFKDTVNKFKGTSQNLGRITSDLQEGVMHIRMVPISQIFSRFPRLVRDLSKSLNRTVKLEISGEETELDKAVIEDLLDPLIHCVRNALDHGIEDPNVRRNSGKSETGHIMLKASNEGNMIVIEVIDDGKGIDVEKIKQKAVKNGLIHPSKVLSDVEAFNLMFEPGFSTAEKVTNISGRGVGLDVVKKQIEKLNGNVTVWSEIGRGTKFTIKLPLTLAIIQGLLVKVASEIYAIPITSVIESHRIKQSEIKLIDNYEVFNVREDVVSLLRLNKLFRLPGMAKTEFQYIVVVGNDDNRVGLLVDSLIGEEDVVIKPLKDRYTNSPGIAGATILGDGTVALIIDVTQLLDLGLKREQERRKEREIGII